MQNDALEPCPNPWCKTHEPDSGGIPFVAPLSGLPRRFQVVCPYCPMRGPCGTKRDCIAAWNTRTIAAPAEREEVARRAGPEWDRSEIARILFDQRQTEHDFDDAEEADPLSDAGTLYSIVHDDADAILAKLQPSDRADRGEGKPLRGMTRDGFLAFANGLLAEVEKAGGDMVNALHIAAQAGAAAPAADQREAVSEAQADRDRRMYEQGRRDERAGEPEAFI